MWKVAFVQGYGYFLLVPPSRRTASYGLLSHLERATVGGHSPRPDLTVPSSVGTCALGGARLLGPLEAQGEQVAGAQVPIVSLSLRGAARVQPLAPADQGGRLPQPKFSALCGVIHVSEERDLGVETEFTYLSSIVLF